MSGEKQLQNVTCPLIQIYWEKGSGSDRYQSTENMLNYKGQKRISISGQFLPG